jgi:hypothetical protein
MPHNPWPFKTHKIHEPKYGFQDLQPGETGSPGQETSDDYRTRQDDEVEALQSIFMEDFQEITTGPGAWSVGF